MVVRHKASTDLSVAQLEWQAASAAAAAVEQNLALLQSRYIHHNRTPRSNTSFSLPYPGIDLSNTPEMLACDVVNLHWVAYLQSPVTLWKLGAIAKPIVWTLHDMWAFTGGCHYSAGCSQYQQTCATCPQLEADPFHLTEVILQDKADLWADLPLVIVAPSQWLADCAKRSQVFRNHRVEVIPYGLETEVFQAIAKPTAKQSLGLDPSVVTLLIGADDGNEQRKGFTELVEALRLCAQSEEMQALLQANRLQILCFGTPSPRLSELNLPLHPLGRIESDLVLSEIYSAADLFILPSLEDNLPNTMLEALSCGTPVLAFAIGGIPDVVQHQETGYLVPEGDIAGLATAIAHCLSHEDWRSHWSQAARQHIEQNYSLTLQASRYLALYEDLTRSAPPRSFTPIPEADLSAAPLLDLDFGSYFQQIYPPLMFQTLQTAFQTTHKQLRQTQRQLERSQSHLQQTEAELQQTRDRLTALETSKFLKMRTFWFKLKQLLHRSD